MKWMLFHKQTKKYRNNNKQNLLLLLLCNFYLQRITKRKNINNNKAMNKERKKSWKKVFCYFIYLFGVYNRLANTQTLIWFVFFGFDLGTYHHHQQQHGENYYCYQPKRNTFKQQQQHFHFNVIFLPLCSGKNDTPIW